ncbi:MULTISPECIES: DUF934 domain-containing protein [Ramlibacter]|uniref:DUF934 domain-containing protein n=1 Tax=Ramlibacter aquaticus TaxID=2780094 RepID=A0ABR9SAJ3_9BURK|nr:MULTISPECIES: DUF934 domain-containing protein [Ramlibacter]MBE7939372.1 DUF934 domain-containing protein [Ramlibacter aquaticus]
MDGFQLLTAPEGDAGLRVLQVANDTDVRTLDLAGVDRVELVFPKFTDGRAFSQALLLRRRLRFAGDIRATGDVLVDQLVQMQRSGFTSAVLKEGRDPAVAQRQFARYPAFYQGDVREPNPLFARGVA